MAFGKLSSVAATFMPLLAIPLAGFLSIAGLKIAKNSSKKAKDL